MPPACLLLRRRASNGEARSRSCRSLTALALFTAGIRPGRRAGRFSRQCTSPAMTVLEHVLDLRALVNLGLGGYVVRRHHPCCRCNANAKGGVLPCFLPFACNLEQDLCILSRQHEAYECTDRGRQLEPSWQQHQEAHPPSLLSRAPPASLSAGTSSP